MKQFFDFNEAVGKTIKSVFWPHEDWRKRHLALCFTDDTFIHLTVESGYESGDEELTATEELTLPDREDELAKFLAAGIVTQTEVDAKLASLQEQERRANARRESQERAAYEALKAKYGT